MARRKKIKILPLTIEVISEHSGKIRELELGHACRVLDYGCSYRLYNTELYQYEQGTISFRERTSDITATGHGLDGDEGREPSYSGVPSSEDQESEE